MNPTAAVLVIGNEILSGKVQDTNSPFLAKEVRALGTSLERIVVVPDEMDTIAEHVRALSQAYTWVFTSGGVGPTHDDITIAAIAQGLGRAVVRPPKLVELLTQWFPGDVPDAALKMAETVEGTQLIWHESIKFPVMQVENIFIFPGIPAILQRDFAVVREQFRGDAYHLRVLYLRVFESDVAKTLHELIADFPEIACGSYPVIDNPDWRVRVTLESNDAEYLERASASLRDRLDPAVIHAIE